MLYNMLLFFRMLKTYLYVPEELDKEINNLAKAEGKSKAEILRKALKEGVSQMKRKKVGSAEILLRIAKLGKKYKVRGPRDASLRMDEYLWDKYDK